MAIAILPVEGAAHPLFDAMGGLDVIEVYFCYAPEHRAGALERRAADPYHAEIRHGCDAAAGEEVGLRAFWNSSATRFVFPKTGRPRAVIERIVAGAESYPAPVNQILIRRGEADAHTMIGEVAQDPRAPAGRAASPKTNQEVWDATLGAGRPLLGSVADDIGLLLSHDSAGGVVTEVRLADPFHPRVRIVGYLGQVDQTPARDDDPRAAAVASALRAAFDRRWPAGAPRPKLLSRAGGGFERVDRIDWLGRSGFAFAVQRDTDATIQPLVDGLRCREDEMIAAAIDVIEAEGLHPALNWERASRVYVINLWE